MRLILLIVGFIIFTASILPASAAETYGTVEYADDCKKALGEIPEVDCLSGAIIPVYDSDHQIEVTDLNHRGQAQKCDKPSLLHSEGSFGIDHNLNACVPYTRLGIGRTQAGFQTSWIWSCRRYYVRPINSPIFDDISMIGHNPSSGATCFFVSRGVNREAPTSVIDRGLNGTHLPSPGSTEGPRIWKTPNQMTNVPLSRGGSPRCTQCHDNDPFIHTPYVHQVTQDGAPMVPSFTNGPYYALGDPHYFSKWKLRRLISPQASTCTQCHAIGGHKSCGAFARMAIGMDQHGHQTTALKKFHWMSSTGPNWSPNPSNPPDPLDAEEVRTVQFLNKCCENPSDAACIWETPRAQAGH